MKIYGAGLAGLLAAQEFQTADIYEARSEDDINHKALLRFRTRVVSDFTHIEFKKVLVHKAIWFNGRFIEPNPRVCNLYSRKVIGQLSDRSIWNLDPVERYIAPENFIMQLIERCGDRIHWSHQVSLMALSDENAQSGPVISTIPMSVVHRWVVLAPSHSIPEFQFQPITVSRWLVKNCDVNQTVYFPNPELDLYRATLTGGLLTAEYAIPHFKERVSWDQNIREAFGLTHSDCEQITKEHQQQFGKIAPMKNDSYRKQFIGDLTAKYNIFSLGRFATWRNILLDDVIKDIHQIKKLMKQNAYDRKIANL